MPRCQAWIPAHSAADNPVSRMLAQTGLPDCTFKHLFRAVTGYTPVEYVQTLRIEEAKQLLETMGEPTDTIAHTVGHDDPVFFHRLFKRRTGITPVRDRQRFQLITRLPPDRLSANLTR